MNSFIPLWFQLQKSGHEHITKNLVHSSHSFSLFDFVVHANENLITWYACYTICDHYYHFFLFVHFFTLSLIPNWISDKHTSFDKLICVVFRLFTAIFAFESLFIGHSFPFSSFPANEIHRIIASLEIQMLFFQRFHDWRTKKWLIKLFSSSY